jgi:hypothetical protein
LHDHAHRIIEIRAFQLIFDRDGLNRIAAFGRAQSMGIVAQKACLKSAFKAREKPA